MFPVGQTNFPMEHTKFPMGQAYQPEAQAAGGAAALAVPSTAPVHSAFGVQAGAPVTVADAIAEANRRAQRLRDHRAAKLRLQRADRRASDRKGKGVDRWLHPGLHPGLPPQGPEASAAAGSDLRHMVEPGLAPATEANVSNPLSGSLHPDMMLRENANADAFLVDPSIDLYRSEEWKDFVAAGQRMVPERP
ncbi:hypothetical protein CMUS01_13867 [Colletotrichum musicola]|uniref:Uncharacterized protein n=1 Tax=Colletotrichum musicola TaxID=2175873 RepID=A0A8H6J8L8_9PEZI|nr:hypothetical protein CMUS01_13867 [Colletotrichum musicola]